MIGHISCVLQLIVYKDLTSPYNTNVLPTKTVKLRKIKCVCKSFTFYNSSAYNTIIFISI